MIGFSNKIALLQKLINFVRLILGLDLARLLKVDQILYFGGPLQASGLDTRDLYVDRLSLLEESKE